MNNTKWTDEEMNILQQMADAEFTAQDIQRVLPYRTIQGIAQKAANMRLSLSGKRHKPEFEIFQQMMKEAQMVKEL